MENSQFEIMWARSEITEALNRYCMGVDLRDEEMLLSAFHPNGVIKYGMNTGAPWVITGHDEIGNLVRVSDSRWADCHHIGSNPVIRLSDDFLSAKVTTRTHAIYTTEDLIHVTSIGRNFDTFTLEDGEWRILERLNEHRFRATYTGPTREMYYAINPPTMRNVDILAQIRAARNSE